MLTFGVVVYWLGLSIAIGFIAGTYDRSQFLWLVISLLISPLMGSIFLLLVGRANPNKPPKEHKESSYQPEFNNNSNHGMGSSMKSMGM